MSLLPIDANTVISQNPSVPSVDLDGEVGLMNTESGMYYSTDEVGSRIWALIEQPISLTSLVNLLVKEYDIDQETCLADVSEYIKELHKLGTIIVENSEHE